MPTHPDTTTNVQVLRRRHPRASLSGLRSLEWPRRMTVPAAAAFDLHEQGVPSVHCPGDHRPCAVHYGSTASADALCRSPRESQRLLNTPTVSLRSSSLQDLFKGSHTLKGSIAWLPAQLLLNLTNCVCLGNRHFVPSEGKYFVQSISKLNASGCQRELKPFSSSGIFNPGKPLALPRAPVSDPSFFLLPNYYPNANCNFPPKIWQHAKPVLSWLPSPNNRLPRSFRKLARFHSPAE